MAREQIPVNPELIAWARERAGYSPDDAAEKFKKIASWEAGEASPTYPQLEQLAEAFKIPIAVFFFPNPPELPPINETFRTLPEDELAQIPRKVRQLLSKAKALQINLYELCNEQNPSEKLITNSLEFSANDSVIDIATIVRDFIGISLEEQISWNSTDDALKGWRKALLSVGVFVFKDAFYEDSYSGFCLYDEVFPIIYVNNSAAKTRQIFTLFHELAHLLFHTSGVDTLEDIFIPNLTDEAQKIEILCNKFAAEFLLPEAVFEGAIVGQQPNEQTAVILAERYHVSREFIFRRFLDRNLINRETYTAAAKEWASQKKRGAGGNPYWTKIAYLGRDYMQLALGQYHQNRINQRQLADYLDTKPRYVGALEEYYARGDA